MRSPARIVWRILVAALICGGLILVGTSAVSGSAPATAAAQRPQLWVVGTVGVFSVSGANFRPGAHVTVRVYLSAAPSGGGYNWTRVGERTVIAGRDGLFAGVQFAAPSTDTGLSRVSPGSSVMATAVDRQAHMELSTINGVDYTLGI